jgi:hypothetical protein
MHDDNKGFPIAPTAENLAAAIKRAADAEDNLRAEVRSNQALVAEVTFLRETVTRQREEIKSLDAAASAINDGMRIVIENLRIALATEKHLANECAEVIKARDQTIADLRQKIKDMADDHEDERIALMEAANEYD